MTRPSRGDALDDEGSRRYLIATAVSRYPKCAQWDRPGLGQARDQIIELFTEKLGYRHHTALGLDPTRVQLTDQLRAFCTSDERREDDLVVVYLSGHGEVLEDGGEHVLLMSDTDPADVTFTALPTAHLARVLRGTRIRRLLLILDTCYSGQGGNELAAAAIENLSKQWGQGTSSSGLVIVSSAQPHQQAQAGLFPKLLAQAISSQATAGHAPAHLSVSAVVEQMKSLPDKPGYQHISLSLLGLNGEPPDFLTNPRHNVRLTDVDLAVQDAAEFDSYALQRETEFTSRFLVRAMGYHGDAAHGWWFCGRHQALTDLAAWLNQDGHAAQEKLILRGDEAGEYVRVVTAAPGSGKTAVLGLLAALAMPERRRTVPVDALGLAPEQVPGQDSVDVVMYAQNLTDRQVLSGLAAAAGFKCATVGEFLETVGQPSGGRGRPFTVLIDALDEAATPDTLCSQIVRPLIEHSRGRIRLLLGTRPYLLDRLGLGSHSPQPDGAVIDLDSPRYADREALLAYTMRNLLQSRRTSPYRSTDPQLLRLVAEAVADAAGTSFLVARFAAYTLASDSAVVANPHSPRWRAGLPRHAGQAMRDDLTRRLGSDAQRATDLLRPLAYAEGQGLPWEDIWAPLASAVSGRAYTDEDLLWLRHHAGSYVVEATEEGRSAYRLYHQALTEHLREATDPVAVHNAFVDTLIDCVPYRGDATRDWSRAHPYTLNHLAVHAAMANRIDDVLEITEYLVHAAPHSLTPHLQDASSAQGRLTAAVYRNSFDLHATATAPIRRNLLALNAARAGAASLLQRLNSYAHASYWLPAWATGHDFTPALRHTLTGLDGEVRALACAILDGRPVALVATNTSRDGDGRVYVWDVETGRQNGEPLAGFEGEVRALACAILDGRPVALVATNTSDPDRYESYGQVSVWDLTTRRQDEAASLGRFEGEVRALACAILDGRPVALVATNSPDPQMRLHVQNLDTGDSIGRPFTAFEGGVQALACCDLDGFPVALVASNTEAGDDARVFVWDVASGHLIDQPLTGFEGGARAMACTVLDGRPLAVIGPGFGAGVHLRPLIHLDYLLDQPLVLVNGPLRALACTVLDNRPVAITVGEDDTVRFWDLLETQPMTTALATGPESGPVWAAASTILDSRPVVAVATTTFDEDWLHVRDLATGDPIDSSFIRFGGEARALACTVLDGRPVAVVATNPTFPEHGRVYVWDVGTCLQRGEPLTGLDGDVRGLACTVLDGRPVAVVALGFGLDSFSHLYVRDLATGRSIDQRGTGYAGTGQALACTVLDGRPVTVVATSTTSGDGGLHVRDLATGHPIGPVIRFDGPARAVACTVLDGRPVALVAITSVNPGWDGRVYLLEVATGRSIGEPFTGFHGEARALACTVLDGRPVAVVATGSDLHVWDIRTGKPLQHFLIPGLRNVEFSHEGSLVVLMARDVAVLLRRSDNQASK